MLFGKEKEGKKILLVDDEPEIVKNLAKVLEREGYEVIYSTNPKEALDLCIHKKPDLAILDIVMPEMSGPEIAMKLTEDEEFKNMPIIFLTGLLSKEEEDNIAGSIPNRTILSKPCDKETLLRTISDKLE